jgi:hypothetical protein
MRELFISHLEGVKDRITVYVLSVIITFPVQQSIPHESSKQRRKTRFKQVLTGVLTI